MTILSFDKATCRALRADLQKVLDAYAAKQGITLTVGNMSFTPEAVSIKMEAKIVGGKGIREQKIDSALQLQAMYDGLSLDVCSGKQLVGYNSRAYKMPYIYLQINTGKRFKTSRNQAKMYFTAPVKSQEAA
jgi:sporulation-control protein spo0M